MPLQLDIKRKFSQSSERVKGVDLHPTEPWILANLYNGQVCIYNYADGALIKSFEAADLPARCSKFIARKQWVAIGSDDMFIRVFNYNTMEREKMFEAHGDYIRSVAVHPSLPYLLSCSDDMLIKLWDWDKGWKCTQVFEGHVHYVMQVVFNPKDTSTFASASLDRTIKVWSISQPTPNFTLEGHEKGVNAVDYLTGGDRPYLVSGADDRTAKVWDYQTKACVQTLEGHTGNVSAVCFHPEMPVIVTASEDGSVRVWHNTTYRLEQSLAYGMERAWACGYVRGSNALALGFDAGLVILKLGRDEPVASMDAGGKVIYARHNDVLSAAVKALGPDYALVDGERLPLPVKDLGSSEIFPSRLEHNSNGRFVVVCGDGEYVVYTALAWRNKSYGSGAEFVWAAESNDFAVRETRPDAIKVFRNFKEAGTIPLYFTPEGITGGALLGVRATDHVSFYDWASLKCVRRIDVATEALYWSSAGDMLALAAATSFYVLRFNRDAVAAALASGAALDDDGVEDAFEVVTEIEERVRTGLWVGDCFIYNNAGWRLNYCVGGEVTVLFHLDRPLYLLGYIAAQQRVYLIDKQYAVVSYTLLLALVEFKTLVMRGEEGEAYAMLPSIPPDQLDGVAKFLEARGHVAKALEVARDADYRFELAVQLDDVDTAVAIAEELRSEARWKQLGEMALADGRLALAETCLQRSGDMSGMMLMHSATGNRAGMQAHARVQELCTAAREAGKTNVAFLANFLLHDVDACVDILVAGGRLPEAALFARTYRPSRVPELVRLWQDDLRQVNAKAAESLASPEEYPNLFPDWDAALRIDAKRGGGRVVPAAQYAAVEGDTARDLIAEGAADAAPNGSADARTGAEDGAGGDDGGAAGSDDGGGVGALAQATAALDVAADAVKSVLPAALQPSPAAGDDDAPEAAPAQPPADAASPPAAEPQEAAAEAEAAAPALDDGDTAPGAAGQGEAEEEEEEEEEMDLEAELVAVAGGADDFDDADDDDDAWGEGE